jgi:hypothetical protein
LNDSPSGRFDAFAALGHPLLEQGFQFPQTARLGGKFRRRWPAVSAGGQIAQGLVNRHRQA